MYLLLQINIQNYIQNYIQNCIQNYIQNYIFDPNWILKDLYRKSAIYF
jgi:hypothetical protein